MREVSDKKMERVIDNMSMAEGVESNWSVLKEGIADVLRQGKHMARKKKRVGEGEGIQEIRKELERWKKERRCSTVEQSRFQILKNRIEKLRKRVRKNVTKEKVVEVTSL